MTISQMIAQLKTAQWLVGDVPVVFAQDSEGNGFFNLDNAVVDTAEDGLVFYPSDSDFGEYPEDVLTKPDFRKLPIRNFINDAEKMDDFLALTKEEFLNSYSYLTEQEYDNTLKIYEAIHKGVKHDKQK